MVKSDSPLKTDIYWVINSSSASSFTYEITMHCGTAKDVKPLKMLSIDNLRDFEEGFADEMMVECVMLREDYEQFIFPNRDKLTVTVVRRPIGTISDGVDTSRSPTAKLYQVTLKDATSEAVREGRYSSSHSEKYPGLSIYPIKFQLIDLAVAQMMIMTVGGIFRKGSPASVLKTELTRVSLGLPGLTSADMPTGVSMYPPPVTAQKPREHLVIPHGVRLIDIAGHLHKHEGGIYDTGIGCYYGDNQWHVFPPYDITRFTKSKKTLTIMAIRSVELPAADCTYRVDGDVVTIVANGKISHLDNVDETQIKQGNGVRFAKAQDLFDNAATRGTNAEADSQKVVASFITQARESGLNYAPFSENRITDNSHYELSKLAMRQGQRIQLNWDRADPTLITPGMPVRFLYESDNIVYELIGTVLNMQSQVRQDQPGMVSIRYITGCALTLFVAVARVLKA